MSLAFFGVATRTHATETALLVTRALAAEGYPVTLIRTTMPGEASLATADLLDDLTLLQRESPSTAQLAEFADKAIANALLAGREPVLDMPGLCLAEHGLRNRVDLCIVPVGPAPLDELAAANATVNGHLMTTAERALASGWSSSNADLPSPPWFLGCGRSGGGPAATAFARSFAHARPDARSPRVVPIVLPALTRDEAQSLVEGKLSPELRRRGLVLHDLLSRIGSEPWRSTAEADAAESLGRDHRNLPERLRDLADELQAIDEGVRPTVEDLAHAPLLDDWSHVAKVLPALSGAVHGHPNFPEGRRISTSDLYATNMAAGWARTLSRYYRLGRPGGEAPAPH